MIVPKHKNRGYRMAHRQAISNGRTGARARTKTVIIERKKLPRKIRPEKELESFTGPLRVSSYRLDGSKDNILIVRFTRGTSAAEREQITVEMNHKCKELFYNLGWRDNGNLKITMNTRTHVCCCKDVLTCINEVLTTL